MDITSKNTEKSFISLADGRQLNLAEPLVMGILNVTPDSFSDGGKYLDTYQAVQHALELAKEGADIIDIGGESTRPGAKPVSQDKEILRVIPVIEAIREVSDIPISIDTYKSQTARSALNAGADIINDITAMTFDHQMVELVAEKKVTVILMHMQGKPDDMQKNPKYDNCVEELVDFFHKRIDYCHSKGIDKNKIIIDPGIGFGKRLMDNIDILAHLDSFQQLGCPLLIGTSRKSFINMLNQPRKLASQRIGGSVASMALAVYKGANIVRVHDVAETVEAIKVVMAIKEKE